MSVLPILAEIGGRGMCIDVPKLKKITHETVQFLDREKPAIESALGIENINSYRLLSVALFHTLGATPLKQTKDGWSADHLSLLWARYKAREQNKQELAETP